MCQSSVLTWILHAASNPQGNQENVSSSDACIETARHVLYLHAEFIKLAGIFNDDQFMLQRYINWWVQRSGHVSPEYTVLTAPFPGLFSTFPLSPSTC